MEYSTILRTDTVFGKNTLKIEKSDDLVGTWSSGNPFKEKNIDSFVRKYLIIVFTEEMKNRTKWVNPLQILVIISLLWIGNFNSWKKIGLVRTD